MRINKAQPVSHSINRSDVNKYVLRQYLWLAQKKKGKTIFVGLNFQASSQYSQVSGNLEPALKRPRIETPSPLPMFKV